MGYRDSSFADLAQAIRELAVLGRDTGHAEAADQLARLSERVSAHQFTLAVLGQFKRGKSTFINALIGASVLPSGVVPVTSVATAVVYGGTPSLEVEYADGHKEVGVLAALPEFVTEAQNPSNRKQIYRVVVRVPCDWLRDGLQLLDVPGLASSIRANTEAALEAMQSVDAAVVVLGMDPPVTEAEIAYLRDIRDLIPRIFFVQNKRDRFSEAEWQEGLRFNAQQIRTLLHLDAEILSVSALQGLVAREQNDDTAWVASGMADLQGRLTEFLRTERYATWARSIRSQVDRVIHPVRQSYAVRRAAWEASLADLEARLARLRRRRSELADKRRELVAAFRQDVRDWGRDLWPRLQAWGDNARPTVAASLQRQLLDARVVSAEEVDAMVDRAVLEALDAAAPTFVGEANDLLHRWAGRLATMFTEWAKEEVEAFAEFAGTRWEDHTIVPPSVPAVPSIALPTDRQSFFPALGWATLAPVLPASVRRRVLSQRLEARLRESMDRALGQLRQHLVEACDRAGRRLVAAWEVEAGRIGAILDTALERTVQQRLGVEQTTDAAVRQLDHEERAWNEAVGRFNSLLENLVSAMVP